MKLDLKVGDYVRTKYGISQYKYYDTLRGTLLCIPVKDGSQGIFANIEDIIKASDKLIDLVEIGDYVNGREVVDLFYNANNKIIGVETRGSVDYVNEDIKSIVTKETFDQMLYKVCEKND